MKDRIKQIWNSFSPGRKRTVSLLLIVLLVIVTGAVGYKFTRSSSTEQKPSIEKKKDISLEPKLLEKSMYMESQKEISELKKQIEEIKQQKETEEKKKEEQIGKNRLKIPETPKGRDVPIPPLPSLSGPLIPPPPVQQSIQQAKPTVETIGEISVVSNQVVVKKEDEKKDVKKKSIYLPPSFMEATLLSGLDAPTIESAKGNPVPVLLRIKDLAVLPNRVKANLKGCFVMAEGHGSLADERAHLRLVSLSCIAKNGQAVIDQKVKGFVVDEDGKIGLRGQVVSKMGSTIARSVLAGFFEGVGDAVKAASTTVSVSPLGTTQTIQAGDVLKVGAGSGISQGANELQKFYLELARQTIPVIEVGATKTVTLVISEGVELEIKDYCVGGEGKCEE
jgi:conjugal transfer pilus assembly protein TraB